MARLDRNQDIIVELLTLVHRIESALVVRDPGSKISADAYDGLRKMLLQSSKNRRIHVSHLLSLSDSLRRGASLETVRDRVNDFLVELGVSYSSDTSLSELFDIVEGDGPVLECIEPAVVEKLEDGRIIEVRRGTARRVPGPQPEVPVTPEADAPEQGPIPAVDSVPSPSASPVAPTDQRSAVSGPGGQRNRSVVIAVVSVVVGLLLGLLVSSGGDDGPGEPTPTTAVPVTSTVPQTTSTVPETTTVETQP